MSSDCREAINEWIASESARLRAHTGGLDHTYVPMVRERPPAHVLVCMEQYGIAWCDVDGAS